MKTVYLVTARLKSTRLTGKLLREVGGRPILAHMLDRLKLMRRVDEIVVCTSPNPQDDALAALAAREHVACFRGDEDDVLARLADAATAHAADYILNITGDCPFVDPAYADRIVAAFEQTGADLIRALDLPHGAYSYGIKPSALRQVLAIKDSRETEAWGRYFTDTDLFRVHDLPVDERHRRPSVRMTLDYPEDLEMFTGNHIIAPTAEEAAAGTPATDRLHRPPARETWGQIASLQEIEGRLDRRQKGKT